MTHHIRQRLFALLGLPLLVISCTSPKWQMQAPCPGSTTEEIISTLTALVAQEGMDIQIVNPSLGILQSSMVGDVKWLGPQYNFHWNFSVRNDTIFAFARSASQSSSSRVKEGSITTTSATSEEYYSTENVDSDADWFWNVYNGITSLCKDQVIVFVKK